MDGANEKDKKMRLSSMGGGKDPNRYLKNVKNSWNWISRNCLPELIFFSILVVEAEKRKRKNLKSYGMTRTKKLKEVDCLENLKPQNYFEKKLSFFL